MISFEWNRESVDHTIQDVSCTVEKIESKMFNEQGEKAFACSFCDMRYYCGAAEQ